MLNSRSAWVRGVWIFLAIAFIAGMSISLSKSASKRSQPVAFNHKKHIDAGMECATCHAGIADGNARAGFPPLDVCASCHGQEDGNPRARAVREYVLANKPIPWKRIYDVPSHVYFSHRRHEQNAHLDCARCHGDMSKVEAPVTRQTVTISMARCMDCHHKMKVTVDCMACHR